MNGIATQSQKEKERIRWNHLALFRPRLRRVPDRCAVVVTRDRNNPEVSDLYVSSGLSDNVDAGNIYK